MPPKFHAGEISHRPRFAPVWTPDGYAPRSDGNAWLVAAALRILSANLFENRYPLGGGVGPGIFFYFVGSETRTPLGGWKRKLSGERSTLRSLEKVMVVRSSSVPMISRRFAKS